MTIAEAIAHAEHRLHERLPAAFTGPAEIRSEARALLRLAAGFSDAHIYAHSNDQLDPAAVRRLADFIERRAAGEPLAYIEGSRGFHALDLFVDPNVLVPRPETELIVDAVLELAPHQAFSLVDLGTGSGAIALAVARQRPDASITGVDLSAQALAVAARNATALRLDVEWLESDWFGSLTRRRFDFICCNPPYVSSGDPHMAALTHEPRLALDGGADGLVQIRRVLADAREFLAPGGHLLLEHGFDQADDVAHAGQAAGLLPVRRIRDFSGHDRVSVFTTRD
jgi:release factor glutamine methyltransferase